MGGVLGRWIEQPGLELATMTELTERDFAVQVVQQLTDAGFQALWAGGCVRDLLRKQTPADYDVATSATPDQVRDLFGRRRTLAVGAAFGVVIVLAPRPNNQQIDVATFRTDAGYSDGRHPDAVTFSTPEQDAYRRDFTINGMFYDPLAERVVDYVGGESDLEQGLIRAIGRATDRIAEDKLRMLRAVRFAARFGFEIEPETRAAIAASASELGVVSGERIAQELRKTLGCDRAAWAVQTWAELGLLAGIMPHVESAWPEQSRLLSDRLNACPALPWQSKLALIVYTVLPRGQQLAALQDVRSRLKLSNEDWDVLSFACQSQPAWDTAPDRPWSETQSLVVSPQVSFARDVLQARESSGDSPTALRWLDEQLARPKDQLDPVPLVTGQDLIDAGLRPGPQFKSYLEQVRARQLDQLLPDRDAALAWLAEQIAADAR